MLWCGSRFEQSSSLGTLIILNFLYRKAYFITKHSIINVIDLVYVQQHLSLFENVQESQYSGCAFSGGQRLCWICWVQKTYTLKASFLKSDYPFKLKIMTCSLSFSNMTVSVINFNILSSDDSAINLFSHGAILIEVIKWN